MAYTSVTFNDVDVIERNSQHARGNLSKTGGVSLTGALCAAKNRRAAVRVHNHTRALVPGSSEADRRHRYRRRGAGTLRKCCDADTNVTTFRAQLRLPLSPLGITRERQRGVHVGGVITGIECEPCRKPVWHG
jgi:hypothetical protein